MPMVTNMTERVKVASGKIRKGKVQTHGENMDDPWEGEKVNKGQQDKTIKPNQLDKDPKPYISQNASGEPMTHSH